MLRLNPFSLVLSAKFISACEQCLHRENCASIIGMPLVFPWALGLRTLASLGCHVICSDEKLEPLCSRHSCPGCPGILASSDSVQKCSHVRIFLRLASTCFAATPCSPPSCPPQPDVFFQAALPGGQAHRCPHRGI